MKMITFFVLAFIFCFGAFAKTVSLRDSSGNIVEVSEEELARVGYQLQPEINKTVSNSDGSITYLNAGFSLGGKNYPVAWVQDSFYNVMAYRFCRMQGHYDVLSASTVAYDGLAVTFNRDWMLKDRVMANEVYTEITCR